MSRAIPLLLISAFLSATSPAQPAALTKTPPIVSSSWLAECMENPRVVLLHVGDKAEFDTAHIPGAQYIALAEISTPRGEGLLTLEMPAVSHLDSVFESKGISDNSTVVIYFGKDWISPAGRVYLTLDYLGFTYRAHILDGGMPAWVREGRPVTRETSRPLRGSFTPRVREDVIVAKQWVVDHLQSPKMSLLDSRTPDFYSGERLGNASRPGHLPGALNVPFTEMVDDSLMFKTPDQLRAAFVSGGAHDEATVVTYCHIGQQASLVYFVARLLGYDARMYDASAQEWSRDEALPMVVGTGTQQ